MPNIVSSRLETFSNSHTVREIHTDVAGISREIIYTARDGDDPIAVMNSHAVDLGNSLATQEVADNMTRAMALGRFAVNITKYSTPAQNVAALKAAWPTLLNVQAIFIGDYLNTLPDATLQTVFGWSPAYEANIRSTFLIPYAAMADNIRNAVGSL